MATYKVWLTVRDKLGNKKEIDGGLLNINLDTLTEAEVDKIGDALPLEAYATDKELAVAVQNTNSIRYGDFDLKD